MNDLKSPPFDLSIKLEELDNEILHFTLKVLQWFEPYASQCMLATQEPLKYAFC